MATTREFIVNKKFLVIFITFQLVITGITLYALLSPKVVTVQVQKIDRSFETQEPLTIHVPELNR